MHRTLKSLLTGIAISNWLAGCSSVPVIPPLVVPCPKLQITPALLQPAQHQQWDLLQTFLLGLPPSAPPTQPSSMLSSQK